jgi:uncharacterized protein YndB with AHSA1/START domain
MLTTVDKDAVAHTMTVTTELDATVERSWQLWADPRQLERWWGPPTYSATVVEHELAPGVTVRYFMTSPDGDKYHGFWEIVAVDPPHRLELVDSFADDSGAKNESMPSTTMTMTLTEREDGGTTMKLHSQFSSLETMEQLVAMGIEEGIIEALGQIEGILTGDAA